MIRIYEDEPNADHSIIHLMLNTNCDNRCMLCCNGQFDLSSVPVVTVEELNNARTILLTGGEPFKIPYFADFVQNLRGQYKNIENLYVYTSGYSMYHNLEQWNKNKVYTDIDGINISPKGTNRERWAIQGMLGKNALDCFFPIFASMKSCRLILMDRKEKADELLATLNLQQYRDLGVRFDVEYRGWQNNFQSNGGVWRRLPVLFN